MIIKIKGAIKNTLSKIHDSKQGTFHDSLILVEKYCLNDSEGNEIEPVLYDIFIGVNGDDSFSMYTINSNIIRFSVNEGVAYLHRSEFATIEII